VQDRETGQPRGFAFVEIADDGEAARAISALNGKEVAGRALKVNEAMSKKTSRDPASHGLVFNYARGVY